MDNVTLSVVGHTNAGKTSLLRTLLRDSQFGIVSAQPSTTQNVLAGQIKWQEHQVQLFDTPGLEDGLGLYEYLHRLATRQHIKHDGPALLTSFLESPEAKLSFEQEAKVIRQVLASDAALYVIDVRDPVLPKYQDELATLAFSARPILPILNFTKARENHVNEWQTALARVNLHVWVAFDSVSPPLEGEALIYQSLATLLPVQHHVLKNLIDELEQRQTQRQHAASRYIADLLIDCAGLRQPVSANKNEELQRHVERIQTLARNREQQCVELLLRLYGFTPNNIKINELAIRDGRWKDDLFHPHSLRQFGLSTGKGAAAGATAGAGIDVFMLGTTLGGATVLGAAIGGMWQSWQNAGKRLRDKARGYRQLTIESSILELLCARQQSLALHLERRAHANDELYDITESVSLADGIKQTLDKVRAYPNWSSLNQSTAERFLTNSQQPEREEFANKLSDQLTLLRIASK